MPVDPGAGAPAGRVTIEHVARVAGVSRQTVSNVVRSRGRVSQDTRERVLQTIEAVGYHPHAAASSLRSRRAHRIAHPMPSAELSPGNLVMVEFLKALVEAAGDRGHQLLLARESDDGRDLAGSASVDGFVLANMSPHDERPARLAAHDIPFACFGRVDPGLPQSWIDVDNTAALRTVTEHLVRAGHRAVTFVGYDTGSYWDREREAGYAATMAEAGLPATVVRTGNDAAAATTRIESLLDGADRPSAVVTGSDALAGAVYAVAARRGLAIGGDLAVTGFDGGILSRMLSPTLTTVVIPVHAIAERLVDRVLRQVDGEDPGQGEVVTLELRLGGSA